MVKIIRLFIAVLAGAAVIASSGIARAQVPAFTFDSPTVDYNNSNWSLGFEFQVGAVPIEIVALGFYQQLNQAWQHDHHVGIFDLAQNLLVDTWVTSGSTLDGYFRYENVPSTILSANTSYRIAGTTGSDNYTWDPVNFQVDPAISFTTDVYVLSNTLAYPVNVVGAIYGIFGPNFKLKPTNEVPEPGALALLVGMGAGGALFLRRRARR